MDNNKSLDEIELIAALLCDAHERFGDVFNTRQLRNTIKLCYRRYRREGISFLTKTMPRLDKHFIQVLAGESELDVRSCGFSTITGSKLPRFLGELFSQIFHSDGTLLPNPNADCVRMIRDILCAFYKYKVPYRDVQEQQVIADFIEAERQLLDLTPFFVDDPVMGRSMKTEMSRHDYARRRMSVIDQLHLAVENEHSTTYVQARILCEARRLLAKVFESFDPLDITPSHGPGVVSTKEKLWSKFEWHNVSKRITDFYPFAEYFCASGGHVCDSYHSFSGVTEVDHSAQVLLVPKDSRGPRLISCEPVDFQWIQQGLSRAMVQRVENHLLTKHSVFFTDQVPNRVAALYGSQSGKYSTLDLKEASDRVHLDLVRLLFPSPLREALEAARSTSTRLPDGRIITLQKYAPMGSALCFPVMALTIWSILTAALCEPNPLFRCAYRLNLCGSFPASAPDIDQIHVYGDDVIVPTAFAESAMTILELFGLKINRSKSCTKGLFKESCGLDAFKGVEVTPVRLRTVWDESPRPDVYTSWISYANSYWDRRYYNSYEYIVARLRSIYGPIPGQDMWLAASSLQSKDLKRPLASFNPCPCLRVASDQNRMYRSRYNKELHKLQFRVRDVTSPSIIHEMDGWSMLLRYFTEGQKPPSKLDDDQYRATSYFCEAAFSVSRYTKRHTSMLVWRWR